MATNPHTENYRDVFTRGQRAYLARLNRATRSHYRAINRKEACFYRMILDGTPRLLRPFQCCDHPLVAHSMPLDKWFCGSCGYES
jgi:hypothetical protein